MLVDVAHEIGARIGRAKALLEPTSAYWPERNCVNYVALASAQAREILGKRAKSCTRPAANRNQRDNGSFQPPRTVARHDCAPIDGDVLPTEVAP
jgi:hypothetical protein